MPVLAAAFAGLFGALVGSFLNVVIHRVPRGDSIVRPPSACPACGTEIRARDNVPLLSWLWLRGRCRDCGAPIAARYPLVEATNALLWIACAVRFDGAEDVVFCALASSVLLVLSMIDLEHRRLPNVIVLPATAVAVGWVVTSAVLRGEPSLVRDPLIGGAAAFGLLFVIAFVSGGMGFGDVKLAAFIGVVAGRFGWEVVVTAIFAAFILGGLAGVAVIASGKKGRKDAIPFGPALAAGALVALFAGPGPVRTWLGL